MSTVTETSTEDMVAIFGSEVLDMMDAETVNGTAESVFDPSMAPAMTSWPCVATATFASSC